MFGRSPIADICHLLESAPVDIDGIAFYLDIALPESAQSNEGGLPSVETRYRKAVHVAGRRLIASDSRAAYLDGYLLGLIHHHARSILMPSHLFLAVIMDGAGIARVAETFQVPRFAAEKRFADADCRQMLALWERCLPSQDAHLSSV